MSTSSRVPADRGLSGLGLIMQLGGGVFGALTAGVGSAALIGLGGMRGAGEALFYIMLIAGTGVARSLVHRQAGADLIYGMEPLAGIKRYAIVSAINVAAWMFVLVGKGHAPAEMWVPLVCLLSVWPAALLIVAGLPGIRDFTGQVPAGEDKGFEGASILMFMLGATGTILMGVALVLWWKVTEGGHGDGKVMMIFIALIVLIIRSVIHMTAGLQGIRHTRIDQAVQSANRYSDFGVVAAFIAGGLLLLTVMMQSPEASALAFISCLVWALLVWPLTIRRFFGERQFADLMQQETAGGSTHRRAPDMGLTTLGWFLLAQALVLLAQHLPTELLSHGHDAELEHMRRGMADLPSYLSIFSPLMGHSAWFAIGIAGLQLWAGIELVRMSELSRIAATAYGAVAAGWALYVFWPVLKNLSAFTRGGAESAVTVGFLAMNLIIPVTTLVAANRSGVPTAQARVRE